MTASFCLLHRNFVCPDKTYGKKQVVRIVFKLILPLLFLEKHPLRGWTWCAIFFKGNQQRNSNNTLFCSESATECTYTNKIVQIPITSLQIDLEYHVFTTRDRKSSWKHAMSGGIDNVSRLPTSRGKFKVRKIYTAYFILNL